MKRYQPNRLLEEMHWLKAFGFALVVGTAAISIIASCTPKMHKVSAKVDQASINTENADSVTLHYSNNGSVRARLVAQKFEHATTAKPPFIAMKNGMRVEFFGENAAPTSVLTAKQGRFYETSSDVLVQDSVVITNAARGEQLRTEELVWNEKRQIFYTEKAVTITTPTQLIYGDGMEANQDFTYYKILNPKGVIAVSKGNLPVQ
jgi:LPS export ABC transporter protein LptC